MKKYPIYSFKGLFDGNFQDNDHISNIFTILYIYSKINSKLNIK